MSEPGRRFVSVGSACDTVGNMADIPLSSAEKNQIVSDCSVNINIRKLGDWLTATTP